MTNRLYYKDSSLKEFEAKIIDSFKQDNRWITVLDRSAFYPTSGGQLFDVGFLNMIEVTEVVESDKGEVHHITLKKIGDIGQTVVGKIDSERRDKKRRQHTAQHILSQAFHRLYNYKTVSVHLGEEYGAIEFETDELSESQIQAIETQVNDVVLNNLSVEILFVDSDSVKKIPLRKPPPDKKEIRIIKIGEYEYSACGGTHCRSTGEIGLIKIIGIEKIRKHVMIKFLCGKQSLNDYSQRLHITQTLTKKLTCNLNDLPDKFNNLMDDNKKFKSKVNTLNKELLPIKAEAIAKSVEIIDELPFVLNTIDDFDEQLLGKLAVEINTIIKGLVIISTNNKMAVNSFKEANIHAGNLAKLLMNKTELKGGGNEQQSQLGGTKIINVDDYKDLIIEYIKKNISN